MGLFFSIPSSIRGNHTVLRPILLPIRAIIRNNCPTSLKLSVPTSVNTKKRDWRKMFRYRTASHAIAQLTKRDFVSLHRDSRKACAPRQVNIQHSTLKLKIMEVRGTLKYRKVQRTPQTGENAGKKKWYATAEPTARWTSRDSYPTSLTTVRLTPEVLSTVC